MAAKRKTSGRKSGGLSVGGNINVTRGDFVAGDKSITVARGGVFAGGNIQGSTVNAIGNQEFPAEEFFTELFKKIEMRPKTSPEDKEDLKANVQEIKGEITKGEQADQSFLSRRLRNIQRIAPDIADVVLATLSGPFAGAAMIIKKVGARAGKSASV